MHDWMFQRQAPNLGFNGSSMFELTTCESYETSRAANSTTDSTDSNLFLIGGFIAVSWLVPERVLRPPREFARQLQYRSHLNGIL